MDDESLLAGLEESDTSLYRSANPEERERYIESLINSATSALQTSELKEAESIENALNDHSISI